MPNRTPSGAPPGPSRPWTWSIDKAQMALRLPLLTELDAGEIGRRGGARSRAGPWWLGRYRACSAPLCGWLSGWVVGAWAERPVARPQLSALVWRPCCACFRSQETTHDKSDCWRAFKSYTKIIDARNALFLASSVMHATMWRDRGVALPLLSEENRHE